MLIFSSTVFFNESEFVLYLKKTEITSSFVHSGFVSWIKMSQAALQTSL